MFDIQIGTNGEVVLIGRFDAQHIDKAREVFGTIEQSKVVDFSRLEYIASAGLGILLATQKKLSESGGALKLTNVNKHIRDVFHFSGFDQIFEIE